MKRIIVNADDFGKSPGRNRAVDDAFGQGLISSAGLIVTGRHLQEAIGYMQHSGYARHVHLHFNVSTSLLHENPDDRPISETMKKDSFFCNAEGFKTYKGLPSGIASVRKWKIVYDELEAQFNYFKELTEGKSNYRHLDVHLWYNLTWPVAVALRLFTKEYNIKSVRFIGQHHLAIDKYRRLRKFATIGRWGDVDNVPATNIDFYLSRKDFFDNYDLIELYCHPNYKDGVLLDDSPSYIKHDRQPLIANIKKLKESGDYDFVSWEDIEI